MGREERRGEDERRGAVWQHRVAEYSCGPRHVQEKEN